MPTFADAVAALTLFAESEEPWAILSALPNQDVAPDGTLADVIDVSWRVKGLPGQFTVKVPNVQGWDATAVGYITQQYLTVMAIYAGLADSAAIGGDLGGGSGSGGGGIGPGPVGG